MERTIEYFNNNPIAFILCVVVLIVIIGAIILLFKGNRIVKSESELKSKPPKSIPIEELHNMELGDSIYIEFLIVIRVPGGWIFTQSEHGATFVPYSTEGKTIKS